MRAWLVVAHVPCMMYTVLMTELPRPLPAFAALIVAAVMVSMTAEEFALYLNERDDNVRPLPGMENAR